MEIFRQRAQGLLDIVLRRQPEQSIISTLEQEFKGSTPIELPLAKYKETEDEKKQPAASLSRGTIEISRVPNVAKASGESITASLVFKPTSGDPVVVRLEETQKDVEIEPGRILRFAISKRDQGKVLGTAGQATIYARGDGSHQWVFKMNVPWGVPETLRHSG